MTEAPTPTTYATSSLQVQVLRYRSPQIKLPRAFGQWLATVTSVSCTCSNRRPAAASASAPAPAPATPWHKRLQVCLLVCCRVH